jgi:hypothetical protein
MLAEPVREELSRRAVVGAERILSRTPSVTFRSAPISKEGDTCLCGHHPIIELCVPRNRVNGGLATVGNCCVKKFIGLPSDLIFQAGKRVSADGGKSLNAEAVAHAFDKGWINAWERDFYMKIMRPACADGEAAG